MCGWPASQLGQIIRQCCEVQEIALLIETPASSDHSNEEEVSLVWILKGARVSLGIPKYKGSDLRNEANNILYILLPINGIRDSGTADLWKKLV